MQLLGFNPLGDPGLPAEAKALCRQSPIGEIRVVEWFDRLNPAHPTGHRFEITPDLPDLGGRGLHLGGDRVFEPASHQATAALVASFTG